MNVTLDLKLYLQSVTAAWDCGKLTLNVNYTLGNNAYETRVSAKILNA